MSADKIKEAISKGSPKDVQSALKDNDRALHCTIKVSKIIHGESRFVIITPITFALDLLKSTTSEKELKTKGLIECIEVLAEAHANQFEKQQNCAHMYRIIDVLSAGINAQSRNRNTPSQVSSSLITIATSNLDRCTKASIQFVQPPQGDRVTVETREPANPKEPLKAKL
jgi:hypothetical protein